MDPCREVRCDFGGLETALNRASGGSPYRSIHMRSIKFVSPPLPPKSRLILVLGILLFFQAAALLQSVPNRHRITHEDIWLMKRVGAPVPSPDGRWAVFSVIEPAYDEKAQVSDLWVVRVDGSERPRRLTNTAAPKVDWLGVPTVSRSSSPPSVRATK